MANIIRNENCTYSSVTPHVGLWEKLGRMMAVWRQRRTLKNLSNAALVDVGLSREQIRAEANRPFWDVPDHWAK